MIDKTMKRFIHPQLKSALLLIIGLMLIPDVQAQIRVSCDGPKVRKWEGEAKVTVEVGKQTCDEAKDLAKHAADLRKESEWFKNKGEDEQNKAKGLRDQHGNRMRDATKRTEEAMKISDRKEYHEEAIEKYEKFLEKRNRTFSEEIEFPVYDSVSVAKSVVNGLDWAMGHDKALEGMEAYETNIMELLEKDELAVDSMGVLLAGEGASILRRAELHEARAQQHFATAAATLQLAERFEGAAQVTERAATMHLVKASLQYMMEKRTADSKRVQKDVERAVEYIQDNLDKLPEEAALYAQYELAKVD